jgi:hypothetical protein
METKMIAVVNPITRVATILHYVDECVYTRRLDFKDLDEWSGFETDKKYDVHFYYDEAFGFYITEYDKDTEYRGMQDVDFTLVIEYTDYDYSETIYSYTLTLKLHSQLNYKGNEQA